MRQADEGKDFVLTRGGLTGASSRRHSKKRLVPIGSPFTGVTSDVRESPAEIASAISAGVLLCRLLRSGLSLCIGTYAATG